jgi:hypothetical protein
MLFSSKHHAAAFASDKLSVLVGDSVITSSASVRNLGVTFGSTLSMEAHVNKVCRSAYAQLRNIGQIRRYLTSDAAKSLTNGLVTSRLDYCNSLLYGLPQSTLKKMQRVQNTAARIITRTPRRDHITPGLKELHWLPIQSRINFKILTTTYKALHHLAPDYITDMLTVHQPTRSLRSAKSTTLAIPRSRTVTYGDRQFRCAASRLWNNLPVTIREARTLNTFKTHLKTHLFKLYFNN